MSDASDQKRLIAALRDPSIYPHQAKSVRVIETHISWVLLAGRYAYKIKKAVDLGFLDYSSLDKRRTCCEEEVRLNRRTAPGIYLDVIAIGGNVDNPRFGEGPAIEYAVRMHRFDADHLMDRWLVHGKIGAQHIDRLAAVIAHFHAGLPAASSDVSYGTPETIRAEAMQNFAQMEPLLREEADRERLAALIRATETEFDVCEPAFASRRVQGFVRECHGDLHLGNIALIADEPVPFDCIEFSPALRWIDVMDEIAFTMMDLLHRGHPQYAWRLLNAILDASGDHAGVSVLRFYLAYRAAVRAKVCAIRSAQSDISRRAKANELDTCRSYLALARRCLMPGKAALIITHGLPGSGKTTFSQFALEQLGAIRIRSDVERKRLYGLSALENSRASAGDIYGPEATKRTYARLLELAGVCLRAGHVVIVDAAFLKQEEREDFRKLAQSLSLPFAIAALYAGEPELRKRIVQRRHDASEADVAVLEKLQGMMQSLSPDENAWSARFTTEEAPDSVSNAGNWRRLKKLLLLA